MHESNYKSCFCSIPITEQKLLIANEADYYSVITHWYKCNQEGFMLFGSVDYKKPGKEKGKVHNKKKVMNVKFPYCLSVSFFIFIISIKKTQQTFPLT